MKQIKNPVIEKKLSGMSRTVKALTKSQDKIAKDMREIATLMGISKINVRDNQEYDDGQYFTVTKITVMQDMEGNDLLVHGQLDYGDLTDQFGAAFEELDQIEVPNSIDFITDGKKNKFEMITKDDVEDITHGPLAIHFLKRGIDDQVAGKFMERLFREKETLPSEWWERLD